MNARIRAEGMQKSQVLETAIMISDIHGPRLAGSSGFMSAANWARGQLVAWGIDNAHLEPWGKRGKGWELERFSVEMLAPYYLRISAIPKAWSPGTRGTVTGTPVHRHDPRRLGFRSIPRKAARPHRDEWTYRASAQSLRRTRAAIDRRRARLNLSHNGSGRAANYWEDAEGFVEGLARRKRIDDFFRDEGAAALLEGSGNPNAILSSSHVHMPPTSPAPYPPLSLRASTMTLCFASSIVSARALELSMTSRFTQTIHRLQRSRRDPGN